MKRFFQGTKKYLSFLMTFVIVFSLFSGVLVVHAAPSISNVRFVRTIDPVTNASEEVVYIFGSGFVEPFVRVGATGTIPATINKTLSTSYTIVIDDAAALQEMKGKDNIINVTTTENGVTSNTSTTLNLQVIPTIEGVSKSKAYVGTPLLIAGSQFKALDSSDANYDASFSNSLFIAGTQYNLDTECDITDDSISINSVKSPNDYGVSDIRIERRKTGNEIITIYKSSITVVNQMTGIVVERVDPNSGPKNKKNIVSIYGADGFSNFTSDMRIFVEGNEGVNKGVITNNSGEVIGVSFELPTRSMAGTVDLVISSRNLSSEFTIPSAFVYLDIGNTLTIDADGVNPNFKKETEHKIVEIKGRNIGFFNGIGYDKVSNVVTAPTLIRYDKYRDYTNFDDRNYYKVKYTGKYNDTDDITIIRQFRVIIDGDATVVDSVYDPAYEPVFDLSKDIIYVSPIDVNLDPNEPKSVDVSIQTITTIFKEISSTNMQLIYNRTEEYQLKDGFTFIPDEVSPAITAVTPGYGPSDKEIYMTITGTSFQVLETGAGPKVKVGDRFCTDVKVYDDKNKAVDGKIITLGTKIKCKLPPGTRTDGAVNVIVINPSGGQKTLSNGFEFRNPVSTRVVTITSVKNSYADMRGGIISGETVVITGENFDTSVDNNPRVLITIDGEKATIIGKVSSDGKTVTVIPPPGTVPGMTKLQIINQDGSMASADFEYKLITSNPKITSIVPIKGGNGTKLIIKGEDFILPDSSVEYNDPKRKGSVVLLEGMELNAYKYTSMGQITDNGTNSIYYDGQYDPDGNPATNNSYYLNGHMVEVQDLTTIYVDIPDRFYSYAGDGSPAPYLEWAQIPLGSLKVEVLNPDGAKSKEDIRFNYMNPSTAPTISSINPDSGSVDGGTVVTIIGSDFRQDELEVYFGSEKSEDVQFVNSGMLRALVPEYPYPLPSGKDEIIVPVMVVNYDGGTAVYYDKVAGRGFKYRVPGSHPVITSITPDTGSAAGGDSVIIKGLDFRRSPDMSPEGLPKVYFNGKEAAVTWPDDSKVSVQSLGVTTPSSLVSGPVDVVLVNYDSGTYTYKSFNYTKSRPSITSVMPDYISKLGNINVQINGSGFRQGGTSELFTGTAEKVNRHNGAGSNAADAIDTIVTFGDESTKDQKMIDTVVGPYYATIDGLRFDASLVSAVPEQVHVKISLASDDTHTAISRYHTGADGSKVFDSYAEDDIIVGSSHMFIINHKMDLGSADSYDEGILVETTPSSVTITRRIAPYAKLMMKADESNEYKQVDAKSPPINSIGQRNLSVINDDGGSAVSPITIMNPDSSPVITSIDPKNKARNISDKMIVDYNPNDVNDYSEFFTFVPLEGGAFITISGSDFRRNVKAYLNDKQLEIVSKSANDDQLVVKIPKGTNADVDKDYRIVVVNEDGGTYDSTMMAKPHYIRYIAPGSNNPVISTIIPDKSSSRGTNNWIWITGSGFKSQVKVLIDGVECVTERAGEGSHASITLPNYENIYARVPVGMTPGKKTVQVQNQDYGFAEVKDGLTIISTPEITRVIGKDGEEINPLVLSVEGGETIKLEGIQFYTGARVIIGGTLKAKSELAQGETGIEGLNVNNAEMVIIGGTQAADVKIEEDNTITFTAPKLSVGETSIIVINSDGGVSNQITGSYEKPMPDAPGGITLEAVDGDTLKLEWNKIEGTAYYEIYLSTSEDGKESLNGYQYLGSIVPTEINPDKLRYFIDGLSPSTWYSIKLKSVNLFGASNLSKATPYKETMEYVKITYYDLGGDSIAGIGQSDQYIVDGKKVTYYVGENSVRDSSGLYVNFEQPAYVAMDSGTIAVSLKLIEKYPDRSVKINDKDVELNMQMSNLNVSEAEGISNSDRYDTAIRVSIEKSLGPEGDEVRIKTPRGYRVIMNPFGINLNLQVKNEISKVNSFSGDISVILKYAESKKALYPGGIYIAYYNNTTKRVEIVNTQNLTGRAQSSISKAGNYVLIGKMVK
ncbi:MAG: IPT/TIG domain-containing protein [Caulobacteraceae bacterium]